MDFELLALLILPVVRGVWILVGYLSGSAFPQPLSKQDEAKALRDLATGDPLARALLIERNLRLVAHVVKKFDNTGEETDDLISVGTVGLIKAIDTFKPEKGVRLATYAAKCIQNEILMFLRARKRVRNEVSIYTPIGTDREGNEIQLMDVLGSEAEQVLEHVAQADEIKELLSRIATLRGKEREVLELRLGIGSRRHTQREIARRLGISRSYVSRIEKRAVTKITERAGKAAAR